MNPRPPGYEPDELPAALPRGIEYEFSVKLKLLVPDTGLEPVRDLILTGF